MTGWQIPGFQEMRELGEGAQGRVVLARHRESGAPVAIKYLFGTDERERERLRHEARMLGQAGSPHIARLYRLVEAPEGAAIVMEAIDGVSLKEILARHGALGPEESLAVLKGSLLGLAAAHALGVVHRDYKPGNVVVPADGCSKLIDFGVAVPAGGAGSAGTPVYMSPEQWSGQQATPATDVYAATCVFVECVSGRRPYPAGDLAALRHAHLAGEIPVEAVPEPLRPLVAAGMAKDPAGRPPGAAMFVQELERVAQAAYGPGWEARGVRRLAAASAALAALFPLAALVAVPGGAAGVGVGAGTAGAGTGGNAVAGGIKGILATATGKVAAAGGAAVVIAGSLVVVQQTAQSDPPPPRPSPTLATRPVAATVAVRQCPVTDALGQRQTPGGTPAPVRLPEQVSLPRGAAVYRFGQGRHLIGAAGQSCEEINGNGAGGSEVGQGAAGGFVRHSYPFSIGSMNISKCVYFPDAPQSRDAGCDGSEALARRQDVPSGVPGVLAMLAGEASAKPRSMPSSPYVEVTMATMARNGMATSVSCVMPWARASICTAALTYWYAEGMSRSKIAKADLDRIAQRVAAHVAASRR
ncbi:serine/threonine-protein kinase [Spirillospora sp. NPDC047279]|uniref:serine/threonine-protein kinase n=1 Tax=Spirillospora sp. NPDC047279 TaxID=3155478 RepID=UPI0033C000CE